MVVCLKYVMFILRIGHDGEGHHRRKGLRFGMES